ncbi:cytochrome c3 family protein [Desulfobaculum bizertense]
MPRVKFPHSAHKQLACDACHHTIHELPQTMRCSSSGCHDMVAPHCPRELRSGRYFKNPFHKGRASCKGCHSSSSAPVQCRSCHKK